MRFCVCVLPWWYVDLQDPGFEFLIQHDVKAEQLMAAVRCPKVHLQQTVNVRFWPDSQHTGGKLFYFIIVIISLFQNYFSNRVSSSVQNTPTQRTLRFVKAAMCKNQPIDHTDCRILFEQIVKLVALLQTQTSWQDWGTSGPEQCEDKTGQWEGFTKSPKRYPQWYKISK